jgi:hypothetical protein
MIIEKARTEIFEEVKKRIEQISSAEPCGTVNMKGYYVHSGEYGVLKNSYFQIYNLYFDSEGIIRADVNFFRSAVEHSVIFGRSLDEFRTDELKKILSYLQRIRSSEKNNSEEKHKSDFEESKHDLFLGLIKSVQSLASTNINRRNSNDSQ